MLFNRIRQFLSSRLWAWPLVAGLTGSVAAVILGNVVVPAESTLSRFLWPGDTAAAASMLGFIASTSLTVLTMTISMTLIVIQVAAGNFSHQLSRDFISSPAVRGILSAYVGVFTYSLLLLRSLDSDSERPPQLAMTVAMLLIFSAVGTFIWYVSKVVDMVRADSVINSSARRTLERAKYASGDPDTAIERPDIPDDAHQLHATGFGYVQSVDVEHAASWAKNHGATVVIDVSPGDSVISGQVTGRYWGMTPNAEGETPELPDVVYLALERVSGQDYSLGLHQMLDIAVRALSPGTNDPTTAEHTVAQATSVLRQIARTPVHPIVRRSNDEEDRLLVWAGMRSTAELVQSFVGGVRRYAAGEPDVLIALLLLLDVVSEEGSGDVKTVADAERSRIVAAAERGIFEPYDLEKVKHAAWHGKTS